MLTLERSDKAAPAAVPDIPLGALLAACDAQPAVPLVFTYDGRTIQRGYHVTEVKAGQFAALDCGANPEAWSEIFVQLWDVIDGDRTHMTAGKFAAIIRKVSEYVGLDLDARLTFEVSDGMAPMQLHCAGSPIQSGNVLMVPWPRVWRAASHATAGWKRSRRHVAAPSASSPAVARPVQPVSLTRPCRR